MLKLWSVATLVAVAACSDAASPRSQFVGSYAAGSIGMSTLSGGIDLRAGGADLTFQLHSNGRLTGRLYLPHGGSDGSALDAAIDGRWHSIDSLIWFEQEPAFLEDALFRVQANGTLRTVFGPSDGMVIITMYQIVPAL